MLSLNLFLSLTACLAVLVASGGCSTPPVRPFDHQGRPTFALNRGRLISIQTPAGSYRVWTKRIGNNPTIKILLLHGGPAATHEYFEVLGDSFGQAGVEYYYYDQLGSFYSDQPNDPDLWRIPRFVEEIEQVRKALSLDRKNFYILGHSWGGVLALEYALKYQSNLKGMIISNMMASIPAYNVYQQSVILRDIEPRILAEMRHLELTQATQTHRYAELLMDNYYEKHFLRMPSAAWPDSVTRSFDHINRSLYNLLQGPSELRIEGRLADWDRTADLGEIAVPTLIVGGRYDLMDPAHLAMMAEKIQRARYLFCPHGSHLAMYDDPQIYSRGLIQFLVDVDTGAF